MRQHGYRVNDTRCQVPLYLWEIKHILKCSSVSKYYFHGCMESFALYVFSNDSSFLNTPIFAQKRNLHQILMGLMGFKCHPWLKPDIRNKFHRKLLNLELFIYIDGFEVIKKSKDWRLKNTATSYREKKLKAHYQVWGKFLASNSPLKVLTNTFYFTFKTLFVIKIFKCFLGFFVS